MHALTSYNESNVDSYIGMGPRVTAAGESFQALVAGTVVGISFYLAKVGLPTGTINVSLYADGGRNFGINSFPTGSPIATSDNIDVSTLSATPSLVFFPFSGANQNALVQNIKRVAVVAYSGGDSNNYINVGQDTIHHTYLGNAWDTPDGIFRYVDLAFYVYVDDVTVYFYNKPRIQVAKEEINIDFRK